MKSIFSTIFYLKRQAVRKDGPVPVMGSITVDGPQTQFSCKITIDPKVWDTKSGRTTGRSAASIEANRMLDNMCVSINKHYREIMDRDNYVTAEKVKNAFLGLEHRCHTLLQVFKQHNEVDRKIQLELAPPSPMSEGQEKKHDLDTFRHETVHAVNPNKDFIYIRPENGYNKGRKI